MARALSSVGCESLPAVVRRGLAPPAPGHQRQVPQPRPQGLHPCESPLSKRECYPTPQPDPLLGFILLQVFPLHTVENAFALSSAHGLGLRPTFSVLPV